MKWCELRQRAPALTSACPEEDNSAAEKRKWPGSQRICDLLPLVRLHILKLTEIDLAPKMTPDEFARKWAGSRRTEKQAAQEHFIDLCRMLDVQTPNEGDPKGYTFEKHVNKNVGGKGFADVWKRGRFGWEYKGPKKDLNAAYKQLLDYREDLENPPLLVVSDLDRFEVHTNFTGTRKVVHAFSLAELKEDPTEPLRILRAVFNDPRELRPRGETREQLTEAAASDFADLAGRLQKRGNEPLKVAHFLNRLLFCLFAEDVRILPPGLLTRLITTHEKEPKQFAAQLSELFGKMSKGGNFGADRIEWFNGGLFDSDEVLFLDSDDLKTLKASSELDWSNIEPAILGTLFERGLDPDARGQLGAHYTDRESIMRVVGPVVLAPLRAEFAAMRARVLELLASKGTPDTRRKNRTKADKAFRDFLHRLKNVTVLDPACGSGNFLYIALQLLHDLEREAILWGSDALRRNLEFPQVGPQVVRGIEINPYAAELARVTIWIGELQWMISHGYAYANDPILRKLETVELRDAVLDRSDPGKPSRAGWPDAEFIVGNPPFIGVRQMREKLGDEYVDALFRAWDGIMPRGADFVLYFHERARELIAKGTTRRAGLLATKGIRTGANLEVLKRIKDTGDIFMAWQNEPWIVEGAAVRISIVGQDDGSEALRTLDGKNVDVIHADLKGGRKGVVDATTAAQLDENLGVAFMGDTKGGAFDISGETARELLRAGPNPNGKRNIDVVVPWINTTDVVKRPRDKFIVDFADAKLLDAAMYEAPFKYVSKAVKSAREASRSTRKEWWLHERPRRDMRVALEPLNRFIVTPTTSKYRLFAWEQRPVLPDHQLIVIARSDDYAFGVLHSRIHEVWSLAKIGRKGVGNDPVYAPTFAFETFPFPWALNTKDGAVTARQRKQANAIAEAAADLDKVRSRWLNPPELVRAVPDVDPGLRPRLVPLSEDAAAALGERTLTNLYNEMPEWLRLAHERLDHAVFDAYGWAPTATDDEIVTELLKLNQRRSGSTSRRKGN